MFSSLVFLRVALLLVLGIVLTGVTYLALRLIGWSVRTLFGIGEPKRPGVTPTGGLGCGNPGCDQKNRLGARYCARCGRPMARVMFDAYG